jgi:hypothetical protein
MLGRSRASSSRLSSGAKKRVVTFVLPASTQEIETPMAAMWNIGHGFQTASPGVKRIAAATPSHTRTSASCEIRQPRGSAVVPEV